MERSVKDRLDEVEGSVENRNEGGEYPVEKITVSKLCFDHNGSGR